MDTSPQVQMNTTVAINDIHVTSAKKNGNQAKKVCFIKFYNMIILNVKFRFLRVVAGYQQNET